MKNTKKFLTPEDLRKEVCVVVGTRPGIIMLAPVIHMLRKKNVPSFVIHTGQHYTPSMDSELFEDLNLPQPDYHLDGVSDKKTHGGQTAVMIEGCEKILFERPPRLVLVNGDANTNLAAALAARKLRIGVGHIEAGERSFDWRMPEEHNRRMIDHISDLLFTTNEQGKKHLIQEGVQGKIFVTGNTIADASINHAVLAKQRSSILNDFNLLPNQYIIMTSHREENVDDFNKLKNIIDGASFASEKLNIPVLFLAHPRTQKRIDEFNLRMHVNNAHGIIIKEALRYLDFMHLLINARIVLTDSGGVQQEAYIHQRPCVTLRDNTEWSGTLVNGANRLSDTDDPTKIIQSIFEASDIRKIEWPLLFGDGNASTRIVDVANQFISH